MTLAEILEVLDSFRRIAVTSHPDDASLRAQNDLLDDLTEAFQRELTT